jgi:hypothetical protein
MTTASCMGQVGRSENGRADMNTMLNNGLKALVCGAVAVAITFGMSWSFLESTATVRNDTATPALWTAKLTMQPVHAWFGQPQPAVLVD